MVKISIQQEIKRQLFLKRAENPNKTFNSDDVTLEAYRASRNSSIRDMDDKKITMVLFDRLFSSHKTNEIETILDDVKLLYGDTATNLIEKVVYEKLDKLSKNAYPFQIPAAREIKAPLKGHTLHQSRPFVAAEKIALKMNREAFGTNERG